MHPASFLTRKWRHSYKGNLYLRLQGITVVLYKGWPGPWYYQVAGEYSDQGYSSEREAKLAAFDAFRTAVERREASAGEHAGSGRRQGAEAPGGDSSDLADFGAQVRRYLGELRAAAGEL